MDNQRRTNKTHTALSPEMGCLPAASTVVNAEICMAERGMQRVGVQKLMSSALRHTVLHPTRK